MTPDVMAPSAPLHREIEWQLASADLERVRRYLEQHASTAGLKIEPRTTVQLSDIYLDTEDFRIFRAGFALRMRAHTRYAEATLKALVSARKDVADRVEITERLSRASLTALGRLPGPVGTRVQDVAGTRALRPLFEVRTRRRRFAVRGGGKDLGEIALDETLICAPGGAERARTQRVEVEAQNTQQGLAPLARLVKELASACDLHRAPVSKFELGLRSTGHNPFALLTRSSQTVEARMAASDAALLTLKQLLHDWRSHEPAARLGDDPGELHQLRIAARRMDAVLELFAPWLPKPLSTARKTVKTVVRSLGAVRDHDLQLASLASFRDELGPGERRALEPLEQHLLAGRLRARKRALQALDALATRTCLEQIAKAVAREPSSRAPAPASRLAHIAPALIRERFRRLRKAFRRLGEPVQPASSVHSAAPAPPKDSTPAHLARPSLEDYHRVRRRAKRLRYALEPLASLYGKPARQLLSSLHRLQDRLGAQQDVSVARNSLTQLVSNPPQDFAPFTLFLAGRLAERHSTPARQTAERIDKAWRKLRGPRWKALKARMAELQDVKDAA